MHPTILLSTVPPRLGARRLRSALVLALALSCAACKTTTPTEDITDGIPTDYRQRHPIAIRENTRSMAVFVGARRGGLTPSQRAEIANYVEGWRREATGGIVVEVPSGTPNARAASDAAREVSAILAQAGVPPGAVALRRYRPHDPAILPTVRLAYPKMTAQAGPCGIWPQDLGLAHDTQPTMNKPYWNLGCANQRNLAAMVDNPADLVQPRAETPAYPGRRSIALDKYRKGESSTTVYSGTDKGTISDVGK